MSLLKAVEKALENEKRTMSWLATELDRTLEGLKLSLKNETIKYSDLKKLTQILNVPISFLFEGTTVQKIKGNHNTQANHSSVFREPESEYRKATVEGLYKQIELLESQIVDKNKIIELMGKQAR